MKILDDRIRKGWPLAGAPTSMRALALRSGVVAEAISMDKALSMFRIFDIAFFAPGAVLFAALRFSGLWLAEPPEGGSLTTAQGVTRLIINLGAIYFLGLSMHALCRVVGRLRKESPSGEDEAEDGSHWYRHVRNELREDLGTYFWYLRATCWNLCIAIPPSVLVLVTQDVQINWYWFVPTAAITCGLLYLLGCDYDRALKNATSADQ